MRAYIGTKIVRAEPAEKLGQPGYKVVYADGYESWSPKDTFEASYRAVSVDEFNLVANPPEETRRLVIPDEPDAAA